MNLLITGASGLIGLALVPYLRSCGHEVTCLVRGNVQGQVPHWDPEASLIDLSPLEKIDGVIHLAGENIGNARWTSRKKMRISNSRVKGTQLLSDTLTKCSPRPKILISASGKCTFQ